MKKKPRISRETLRKLITPEMYYDYVLPKGFRISEDEDLALAHDALQEAIHLYLDAAFDPNSVAHRLRAAADQVQSHKGGEFDLDGREDVEQHKEIYHAHMLLDDAIRLRLERTADPETTAHWLRAAAQHVEWKQPKSRALMNE